MTKGLESRGGSNVRVAIQQRVLASYRAMFFERLAVEVNGLDVFSGEPRPDEAISTVRLDHSSIHHHRARNFHIGRGHFYLCWQSGLRTWLTQVRPDVLITEANPRILSNWWILIFRSRTDVPIIGWGLGVMHDQHRPMKPLRRAIMRLFFSQFDAFIGYSRRAVADYIEFGVPAERVHLAINAVSEASPVGRMGSTGISVKPMLSTLKMLNQPTLIYVGRLLPAKLVDVLIEAWHGLSMRATLVIVGDGPYRRDLEEIAAASGRKDIFFVGDQRGDNLAAFFRMADLAVMPGAGGLAIQEAFSHGVPVVAGRKGDGSEEDLITDGETGFFLSDETPNHLREVLSDALTNRSLLRQMGAKARKKVVLDANVTEMARSFVGAIQSVHSGDP